MVRNDSLPPDRSSGRRYVVLLLLVLALFAGWSALWWYAAGKAEETITGWIAREAEAGRIYTCGSQTLGGYPFRIEVDCVTAAAEFRGIEPPLEVKTGRVLIAAQIYQPTLLIGEYTGPLTIATAGQPPVLVANWRLFQSSARGTPDAPERVSLVFDGPVLDRMAGGGQENLLSARHLELHGRMIAGSASDKPVLELALRLERGSMRGLHPAAAPPIDADVVALLRGLDDFRPKSWPQRFREIQAADGSIEITQARVQQGETLAVGAGMLSLSADGYLRGQLRLTVAGLDPFLEAIGAPRMVQNSPNMDKLAGVLDRFAPGLGDVARQQAGANLSAGIKLLGEPTTLEGKPAVALPLRFDNGRVYLGPIPLGNTPALF